MSIRSDETNARAAAALRGKPKRRVGRKPTSGNGKPPAWYSEVMEKLKQQQGKP